ncbi:MAG: proton-conducting transporter membrane subunit [Planctomycetota bacterium]
MQSIWMGLALASVAGAILGGWAVGVVWAQKEEAAAVRFARWSGRLLEALVLVHLAGLACGFAFWILSRAEAGSFSASNWQLSVGNWSIFAFDGTAWLMSLLVAFVGWSVCRFSRQYLAGDARQAAYWGWLAATLGSVQLMVAAGNLLVLLVAWTAASLFLHQLLLYHGERPLARRAAATKYTFSRLADVLLYGAAGLLYWRSGTLEFELLEDWLAGRGSDETLWVSLACILFALGAAIRSAQVPFHFWLPLTLETPTPVSALMHAGIVNGGGFAAIRLSFLLVQSPLAMNFLALLGLATAVLAGLVMLTQPTIKGSLAWSTVAQMGFMFFQCGLDAFSAALLHIIAHSLYKAHAFLSSGSVMAERSGFEPAVARRDLRRPLVAAIVLLATGLVLLVASLCGLNLWEKPGGVILGSILSLGIATWLLRLAETELPLEGGLWHWLRGLGIAASLAVGYFLAWRVLDGLVLPPKIDLIGLSAPWLGVAVWAVVASGLIWNRGVWAGQTESPRLEAWRVHASQGFYLDSLVRRTLGCVAPSLQR